MPTAEKPSGRRNYKLCPSHLCPGTPVPALGLPQTFICWTCGECFDEAKLPPRSILRDAADREILDKVGGLFKNVHDSTIADLLNIIRDEKEKAFIAGAEWVQKVTRAHVRRQYMRDTARMRYPLW